MKSAVRIIFLSLRILLAQPYNKEGHSWPPEKTADTWERAEQLIEQELGWSSSAEWA